MGIISTDNIQQDTCTMYQKNPKHSGLQHVPITISRTTHLTLAGVIALDSQGFLKNPLPRK